MLSVSRTPLSRFDRVSAIDVKISCLMVTTEPFTANRDSFLSEGNYNWKQNLPTKLGSQLSKYKVLCAECDILQFC